jgi:hypothetical protein
MSISLIEGKPITVIIIIEIALDGLKSNFRENDREGKSNIHCNT